MGCKICEDIPEVLYRVTYTLQELPEYLCERCIKGVVHHNCYREAKFDGKPAYQKVEDSNIDFPTIKQKENLENSLRRNAVSD